MGVARVSRISDRFEQIVEARDAATVLWRSVSFAAGLVRIGDARLAGANVAHGEAALNQKKMESIRNHLAGTAKDRALTQADVDAYAALRPPTP